MDKMCDANCTVSVDGQGTYIVPCKNGNLSTNDSNLSNKMVMIVATDAIGNSQEVSAMLTSEGKCKCNSFNARIKIV